MDELEILFIEMLDKYKDKIVSTLKTSALQEMCELCYELLSQAAHESKQMNSEQLYQEVLKVIEKNDS